MAKGRKKVFQTKLTDVCSTDKEGVGTIRQEGDDEYIFCKGVASTAAGNIVTINEDYETALLTTALGAAPRRLGIAKAAIVANKYGWYQIKGVGVVYAAANCAKDVTLYTDTSTTGGVGDTSTDEHAIRGLVLTATNGASAANTACIIDHPWT